ncbi:MAG: ABC transporter ATP-binding protein/permease [Clostridiales bacterium]|uniref:ABC transporter ATP-binding protein n=1 Tax=Flavonifractor porci TaxID=3133422 RepID=UPI0030A06CB9|nr:ABC transporter ATP-binding protein/permease [Clostridiales bacterium]
MKKKRGLISCIGEFKLATVLTPIFVIGEVAFDVLIPMMTGRLLDEGVKAGNMNRIIQYGLLVVAMALMALLLGGLSGRFAARASTGFSRNLRREMYQNVQKLSFSNIDKFSTGGIITRLTTDVTNVQMAFMMIIRIAVRCPIMLVCAWFLTFTLNPKLALIFLVVIPVLAVGILAIMKSAYPVFKRVFKKYDWLNNVVEENLLGIRVVKSFVRQEHEKEKFGKVSGEIYMDFSKAEKIVAFNMPLMQICVYACMLAVSWIGANLVVGGELTTGQLTSMFSYIMMILMSLMMLSMVLMMIILSKASAERIVELLNEESDLKNGPDPIYEVKDGSVVFENVSFSYAKDPTKECLKDVNLTIKSGETVGILGGTGTSKTTLVQLIPRLYDATEGRVLVGGVDVRDYDMEALREQVAMVLQKNVLFSGTIKENLRWGNKEATDEEMVRVCKLAQADSFIQEFPDKYDTHIEQGGSNVSGGQKQRLCIARALLKKPKILILDDSTSAVDTKTDALIRKAFREEIPDTTKFIIAQRISSIEDVDKILVMDGGKIAAIGTHEELLKTCEIYREIYESQTKGGGEDET